MSHSFTNGPWRPSLKPYSTTVLIADGARKSKARSGPPAPFSLRPRRRHPAPGAGSRFQGVKRDGDNWSSIPGSAFARLIRSSIWDSAGTRSARDRIPWKRANRLIHSTEERSVWMEIVMETEHRADFLEECGWLTVRRVGHIRSPSWRPQSADNW
jgi:hypothetical protein